MGNAPAMLLALRTFQFAVSSVSPGQAYFSSSTLIAGQCGLRSRQTATWSSTFGGTQACSEFGAFGWTAASPAGQSGSSPVQFALTGLCEFFSLRA